MKVSRSMAPAALGRHPERAMGVPTGAPPRVVDWQKRHNISHSGADTTSGASSTMPLNSVLPGWLTPSAWHLSLSPFVCIGREGLKIALSARNSHFGERRDPPKPSGYEPLILLALAVDIAAAMTIGYYVVVTLAERVATPSNCPQADFSQDASAIPREDTACCGWLRLLWAGKNGLTGYRRPHT